MLIGPTAMLLLVVTALATSDWPANATPPFPPSWRTNDSTLLYWRNGTGYQDESTLRGYGLLLFDWAHAAAVWIDNGGAGGPMDNGAVLAEQCRRLKARANPAAKCVVYRNTVKALNQFADVSALLDDPGRYAGFFLPWKPRATYQSALCDLRSSGGPPLMPNPQISCRNLTASDVHVPMCDGANRSKCSRLAYFGTHQIPIVPGAGRNWANTSSPFQNLSCVAGAAGGQCDCGANPCGEYLFDFRNASMREWFVDEYMASAMAPPHVDGLVLDDSWGGAGTAGSGPSEEEKHCLEDAGLVPADVAAITAGWRAARDALLARAAAQGSYIAPTYGGDSLSKRAGNSSTACAKRMRFFCGPGAAQPAAPRYFSVMYDKVPPPAFGLAPTNMDLDMAYFLAARGPYAWVGSGPILGWQLSHWWAPGQTRLIEPRDFRPHWFDVEFGEPAGACTETVPDVSGVFTRNYSKASVRVDCPRLSGSIRMVGRMTDTA